MIRPSLPALATCWSPGEYATAATASAWPTSDFSLDLRFRSQMVTSVAAPAEARYRLPLLNASARTGGRPTRATSFPSRCLGRTGPRTPRGGIGDAAQELAGRFQEMCASVSAAARQRAVRGAPLDAVNVAAQRSGCDVVGVLRGRGG